MEYLIHIAILVCLEGVVALSLHLLIGETGLVSVAQAGFAGVGAYAAAILLTRTGMNFFLVAPLAMAMTGVVALVTGLVFLRLREVYYVLGTVGFSIIVWNIFSNWQSVTQGPFGIPGIPRPVLFGFQFSENAAFLALALTVLAGAYAICRFVKDSSFGRVLNAIREDEEATAVFGYATFHYKLFVFVIAAMMAACAGALFASYITYIDPSSFVVYESVLALAFVILGGIGSARGAVLGAFLLMLLPEMLRFAGFSPDIAAQMRQVVYGLILIFFMLYRPQGILGTFRI